MDISSNIYIKGARENNLKNINVTIPKNKITVITGVSGSGKSSLAFDTIFALGKAMYMEALTNSIAKFEKPDVDHIRGLMPPIALTQNMTTNTNPRSTVGTFIQINGYLRLLFSILGEQYCPDCRKKRKLNNQGNCRHCDFQAGTITSNMFSFNHVNGMCLKCSGLGTVYTISEELIIPNNNITLDQLKTLYEKDKVLSYVGRMMDSVLAFLGLNGNTRYCELSENQKKFILYGSDKKIKIFIPASSSGMPGRETLLVFPGFVSYINKVYMETSSEYRRKYAEEKYMHVVPCPECEGQKLNKVSLNIRVLDYTFPQVLNLPIDKALIRLNELKSSDLITNHENEQLKSVITTISFKLQSIIDVGLSYLTLDRGVATLSGGEAQRLRLSNHLNSELTDVLYIFDEPSAGLHHKDIRLIIEALKKLRNNGNTLIIVEHKPQVIKEADCVIDIGPRAGKHGGNLVAFGSLEEIKNNYNSLTGRYLSRSFTTEDFSFPKKYDTHLHLSGINIHNLKNVDTKIPLNAFVCITGVSGSGKSTLIYDFLYKKIKNYLKHKIPINDRNGKLRGVEAINEVHYINQNIIGRNKRSTIATYSGLFPKVRNLFANTEFAKKNNIPQSDFGLNGGNGRCKKCEGLGYIEQDMYFLPSVKIQCDSCNGSRFLEKILEVKYNGYNVSQVLNLTVEEACKMFSNDSKIKNILETLAEVGLDYIKLGQSIDTLSGGECQRLKLANELYQRNTTGTLYIFDEPSAGLHLYDVEKLILIFKKLVKTGNSVIIIEHNMTIIQQSDYIIDLGPEGGVNGGEITAVGHPSEIIKKYESHTSRCLSDIIKSSVKYRKRRNP